jgi:hypothetical protein
MRGKDVTARKNVTVSSTLWTLIVCEYHDSLYEGLLIARDSLTQRTLEL